MNNGFEHLAEAMLIFGKYSNTDTPTHCEHDTMYVMEVKKEQVSEEDQKRLDELGFFWSEDEDEGYISFWFGSA